MKLKTTLSVLLLVALLSLSGCGLAFYSQAKTFQIAPGPVWEMLGIGKQFAKPAEHDPDVFYQETADALTGALGSGYSVVSSTDQDGRYLFLCSLPNQDPKYKIVVCLTNPDGYSSDIAAIDRLSSLKEIPVSDTVIIELPNHQKVSANITYDQDGTITNTQWSWTKAPN